MWIAILVFIVVVMICAEIDMHRLDQEANQRIYLFNERLRIEAGKPPISWKGSMQKYSQECKEIDESGV